MAVGRSRAAKGTSAEDRQRLLWSERVGSKRSVTLCPFKAMGFRTVEADKALPKIAISVGCNDRGPFRVELGLILGMNGIGTTSDVDNAYRAGFRAGFEVPRSEEHTYERQSLMPLSY